MKTAVVTITIGDIYERMAEITHPSIKAYADRLGSDFIIIKDLGSHKLAGYCKLEIHDLLDTYDRVLFVDTDIIIRPDSPNIFHLVPEDEIGMFEEGNFSERRSSFSEWCQMFNVDDSEWDGKYYNTGVIVVSKCHKVLFVPPLVEHNNYYEQTYLNVNVFTNKFKVFNLPYQYNRMSLVDKLTGDPRHASYFIHYAGAFYNLQGILNAESILFDTINKDLDTWKIEAPDYKFKRNVAVIISGGLGDQIAAEPTARYVVSELYKNQNVVIQSHYPELFSHLKDYGATILQHGDVVKDSYNFFEINTLPSHPHPFPSKVSHTMTHAVDYASLAGLRMQLPVQYRSIKLPYNFEAKNSILDKLGSIDSIDRVPLIVVHPGRGWPSKTFPVDIWQSYIDALVFNRYKVIIIGKHIDEDQGYVNVSTDGCIDLRDKLSLNELVELIRMADVLISNDSSPVHIAGASDCWIGLIATCKSPDYILPYRNGSIYYKAKSLEKQPMYFDFERKASALVTSVINQCTDQRLRDCLPEPQTILDFVNDCLRK